MGKIKTKTIKRTANTLMNKNVEVSKDFGKNKKILGNLAPSKKVRNQLAGYLVRLKKQEEKKQEQLK